MTIDNEKNLKNIGEKIEVIRLKLNYAVDDMENKNKSGEILTISRELDELINKYMKFAR